MKLLLSLTIVFLLGTSQKAKAPEPKTYTVSLTLNQWQEVIQVIDQSQSPHIQVKAINELIVNQVQKQLSDTTKTKK
jgi:hypothetical protein